MGEETDNQKRYKVYLSDESVLRAFDDPEIAMHYSEQVWYVGKRHNTLKDTVTGKVMANF